jgi:hypothetical protein
MKKRAMIASSITPVARRTHSESNCFSAREFLRECSVFRREFEHSEKQMTLASAHNVKAVVSAILF